MRMIPVAAAMAVLLAAPAHAQLDPSKGHKTPLQLQYEQQDRERADVEREYNAHMQRSRRNPPPEVKHDPWAIVRPTPNTTPAAKDRR